MSKGLRDNLKRQQKMNNFRKKIIFQRIKILNMLKIHVFLKFFLNKNILPLEDVMEPTYYYENR